MATEVTSINELNEEEVKEQQAILTEFLQEKYPNAVVQYGVMHDLVNYLNAIFSAKERKELENWKSARSLLAITENPDIADTDSVDNILSNYNVYRQIGTHAYGTIQLEFSVDSALIIPANTIFSCNGITYVTEKSYLVYQSGNETSTVADRVLQLLDSGNYGCTVDVVATTTGSAGCIKKGSTLSNDTLNNLVVAYAYNDFKGGVDTEDNLSLINRLKSGISTPCWGNRENIKSILFNSAELPEIVDASVIGFSDKEMTRDQVSLFPISTGGKVDLYIKTAPYSITTTETLTASVYQKDIGSTYWVVTVPSSMLYGMWRVTGVYPEDASINTESYELISQQAVSTNEDLSDFDAAYTIYQDIILKFRSINDDTPREIGDYKKFKVSAIGFPNIYDAHTLCHKRSIRPVASDVLIKAAVPCIVSAEVKIKYTKNSDISEDTINDIKAAVTKKINDKTFTSYLTSAELSNEIKQFLSGDQNIAYIQLTGIIMGPGGTLYRLVSPKQLEIPEMPLKYVSPKTTVFLSDINYIDIVTEAVNE